MTTPSTSDVSLHDGRMPRSFWIALVPGVAVIGFGLHAIEHNDRATVPAKLARWVIGLGIAHDAIVVPVTIIAGLLLDAIVRGRHRRLVRGAVALSAILTLFVWPGLRRYGQKPDNRSALPHHYWETLAVVLAVVWAVTAAIGAARHLRDRGRSSA